MPASNLGVHLYKKSDLRSVHRRNNTRWWLTCGRSMSLWMNVSKVWKIYWFILIYFDLLWF
jgi:hypothetical protein